MRRLVVIAFLVCGSLMTFGVGGAVADGPDYTWNGDSGYGTGGPWSDANNWSPSGSPQADSTVGTLTFPTQTYACPPLDTSCLYERYDSNNDVPGITATAMDLSLGGGTYGYDLTGDGLALGSGGLTVDGSIPSSGDTLISDSARLELPLTLADAQTWSITGPGSVTDAGGITGGDALAVDVGDNGGLNLTTDTELGAVSVTGADSSASGLDATSNGGIQLSGSPAALNATNGEPVSLNDAALTTSNANGEAVGPITSSGGLLQVTGGALSVAGSLTLDSTSALALNIDGPVSAPGVNFSQISATGDVALGGTSLAINLGSNCGSLPAGAQYPLIISTGTITGEIAGITNGTTVTTQCLGSADEAPTVAITYTTHAVVATVVYSGAPPSTITTVTPPTLTPPLPQTQPGPVQSPSPSATTIAPSPGIAAMGAWKVHGTSASTTASCAGASDATCAIALALTVTAVRKHGRLTAVAAGPTRSIKAKRQTISIGRTTATLSAGHGETVTVALNSVGQGLLKEHHALAVDLTASSGKSVISRSTITFYESAKARQRANGPARRPRCAHQSALSLCSATSDNAGFTR